MKLVIFVDKLVQLVGEIEDKVAAYIQNMKISQTAKYHAIKNKQNGEPNNIETLENDTPRRDSEHK